jgi:hypothetical protein
MIKSPAVVSDMNHFERLLVAEQQAADAMRP